MHRFMTGPRPRPRTPARVVRLSVISSPLAALTTCLADFFPSPYSPFLHAHHSLTPLRNVRCCASTSAPVSLVFLSTRSCLITLARRVRQALAMPSNLSYTRHLDMYVTA